MEKRDLVEIRDYLPADRNFVLATWLRGLRYGNDMFNLIESDTYFSTYQRIIEFLLARPGAQVKVVCLKDDPEVILGYSASCGSRLDWLFVKGAWRKIGIGKMLLPADMKEVSHITKLGLSLMRAKLPGVTFNPFF